MPGDAIAVVAGLTLIGFAVREIFRDLFYPSDSGVVSDWIARSLFDLLRRARSWLPLAGPAAVVVVIVTWVAMLAVGFALLLSRNVGVRRLRRSGPRFDPVSLHRSR
jgi:predicted PurR-regulated permease PerM